MPLTSEPLSGSLLSPSRSFLSLPTWVPGICPVPGLSVRAYEPTVCGSLLSVCVTACGAPASHLASLHLWVSLCLTLAGSALDWRGGGVGETINLR